MIISEANGNEITLNTGATYQVSIQVDKSALSAKIATATSLISSAYTTTSWSALQTAITAAISANNDVNITQAQISTAVTNLQTAINNLQLISNLTALSAKINEAQAKSAAAVIGVRWGQYSESALTTFRLAITNAISVSTDTNQSVVDQAVATLNQAIVVLQAAGRVSASVGDLGMVAANYGASSVSVNWESIKLYDFNLDNKLDIIDLAAMARKVLGQ